MRWAGVGGQGGRRDPSRRPQPVVCPQVSEREKRGSKHQGGHVRGHLPPKDAAFAPSSSPPGSHPPTPQGGNENRSRFRPQRTKTEA